MSISQTYLQYGVSLKVAKDMELKALPVSTFRITSKKNLKAKYGIDESTIDFVKNCITREPIPEEVMDLLLENNNYCCCLCKNADYGGEFADIDHLISLQSDHRFWAKLTT